jgi:hypothetical protein
MRSFASFKDRVEDMMREFRRNLNNWKKKVQSSQRMELINHETG